MIDAKAAYKIMKKRQNKHLVEAVDFGDFFGFIFLEHKPSEDEPFACGYDCIDKRTGKQFTFSPFEDFDVFDKAISIPIEELI